MSAPVQGEAFDDGTISFPSATYTESEQHDGSECVFDTSEERTLIVGNDRAAAAIAPLVRPLNREDHITSRSRWYLRHA